MRYALSLLLLFVCSSAFAQALTVQGEIRRDHFVRVSSEVAGHWLVIGPNIIQVEKIKTVGNLMLGSTGVVFRETIVVKDGKQVVFVGPPGAYAIAQIVQEEEQPRTLVVTVPGKPEPEPTPPPEPKPRPKPNIPDGQFGIAEQVHEWVLAVHTESRSVEIDGEETLIAQALADNFESTAAALAAGGITSVEDANATMTEKNRAIILHDDTPESVLDDWLPWFESWKNYVDKLIADDKLSVTVSDYQTLYEETVVGLRSVKDE